MTPKKPTTTESIQNTVWVTVDESLTDAGTLRRVQRALLPEECIKSQGGLAVIYLNRYRVMHVATGKRISGDFDTPDAALALMAQLLPMTDWTQDAPNLDDSVNTALANFGAGPGTEVRMVQP